MLKLVAATLVAVTAVARPLAAQDDRWQISLDNDQYVWDIRLVRLDGDSLFVRQADSVLGVPGAHQGAPAHPEIRSAARRRRPRRCHERAGGRGRRGVRHLAARVRGADPDGAEDPADASDRAVLSSRAARPELSSRAERGTLAGHHGRLRGSGHAPARSLAPLGMTVTTTPAERPRMDWNSLADRTLAGHEVTADEALAVLRASDDDLLPLLHASFRLRERHHRRDVRIHVLRNAKSGLCPENCAFCSQSVAFHTEAPRYQMQSVEELVEGAHEAARIGAVKYCMVTSTRGPSQRELDVVCEAVRRIKAEVNIRICTSPGAPARGTGGAARDGGRGPVQPQSRGVAPVLSRGLHDARIRRPGPDGRAGPRRGDGSLLRRDHGSGRDPGGPGGACARASGARGRIHPGQLPRPAPGHPAGRAASAHARTTACARWR